MAGNYVWLSFLTARQQLAARLADPAMVFWTDNELKIYIQRALRMFNALTFTWKNDFAFNNPGPSVWNSLATLAGSPRLRTLTTTDAFTFLQYSLLEAPTGQVWSGTNQFNINDLSVALQTRRDEMLVRSACNDVLVPNIPCTPNVSRVFLPDNALEVQRLRYIAATVQPPQPQTPPVTLYRDDTVALEFYDAPLYQLNPQTPQTYSLSSEPPLSFDVYPPPNQPGTYEAIVLQSGAPFVPPTPTLLNVPDDFVWALEYGALADLLGRESEATDRERAAWCLQRYQDGLVLLKKTPWIMEGRVNGAAVSVDSLADSDRYSPEWDSQPTSFGPVIVTAGIDLFGSPTNAGIGLTVLGNAPVPVADGDFLQCSRANIDTIYDLAQSFACFKMAGSEWKAALELEQRAILACAKENDRLKHTGAFSDVLIQRGTIEDMAQERYSSKGDR